MKVIRENMVDVDKSAQGVGWRDIPAFGKNSATGLWWFSYLYNSVYHECKSEKYQVMKVITMWKNKGEFFFTSLSVETLPV